MAFNPDYLFPIVKSAIRPIQSNPIERSAVEVVLLLKKSELL
jgi:hypothetical protein